MEGVSMKIETIKLEDSSGLQLIRLPDSFKINDDKVYLKKVDNVLYVIPYHNAWQSLVSSVNEFTDAYMSEREQPADQKRESIDS
jgi:antitoxin VapB